MTTNKGASNKRLHPYSNNEHDIDWEYQNQLREQWLKDNPDATYIGWMSI